ncbi:hypothetical protein AB4084_28835, partial [Lysobacter sp. 2RAB21]
MTTSSMDQMSRAQREALLARAKAARISKNDGARQDAIAPRAGGPTQWPSSFAQQRLWLISQMGEQASAAYHVPVHFSLRG